MSLTAIVIAKNAANTIERCLNSLDFADEKIVVVDSTSTDATARLAEQNGAHVFTHPWSGFGPQKNFAAAQAQSSWLLFIDADEEVPGQLAQEIQDTIAHPATDFYWLRIIDIFLSRPLSHLSGHNPRLFKKASGHWNKAKVHEQVETNNHTVIRLGDQLSSSLTSPLIHHSHATISSYLSKMHHYTTLDAQHMHLTGRHRSGRSITSSPLLPPYLAARQFLKLYLYRRGFLDGYAGFIWCALSAYYEYQMGRKYIHFKSK